MSDKSRLKIVFIGGSGRSGSTLLDLLLGQVDGFFSLGEMCHIWERSFVENQLCGCGKPFKSCDFWRVVVEEAFGGFDCVDGRAILKLQRSVARIRHIPQLTFPKLRSRRFCSSLSDYIEILERLYWAIAKISKCEVLVDSSKLPSHGFVLSEIPTIDLHVIHLVRDSRAVVHSWQKKKRRPEIYWKEEYMPRYGLLKATYEWILSNWLTELLGKKADFYTIVWYKELSSKPRAVIKKLLDWVSVGYNRFDFFSTDNVVCLGINHTVSGNPMRFKTGDLVIRPDLVWEKKLSPFKRYSTTLLTYPLLKRYSKV